MNADLDRTQRWRTKFAAALRGIMVGSRGQSSFAVHLFATVLVVVAAAVLGLSAIEWCVIVLAISMVLMAEMFNSSLEWLARAITDQHDARIGNALDIASGAVLLAAFGAVVVGLLTLGLRLLEWLA